LYFQLPCDHDHDGPNLEDSLLYYGNIKT
jgi:hypothetical protein